MKGDVSVYAIFIVVFIGIALIVVLAVTNKWTDKILPAQANEFGCRTKLAGYCTDWYKNNFGNAPTPSYSDRNPKTGCEQFTKIPDSGPSKPDQCKELLGIT